MDADIYGVSAVIAVDDDEGRLLDVCRVSTGNATGHLPRQHDDPARNRSGLRKRHAA